VSTVGEALAYAARGWPVLPLWWPTAGRRCACTDPECGKPAKHPVGRLVPHGKDQASADPVVITSWWASCPSANVGIRTGAVSGLVVLDVDGPAGRGSLRSLVDRHGRFPAVWVRTGSGGWHAYLAHPGVPVANSVRHLGDGLDVRGDGGYVVAPPSVHVAGGRYRWQSAPPSELPSVPAWLVELTMPPPPPPPPPRPVCLEGDMAPYVAAAVEGEAREVAEAPRGQRNNRLFRAACRLGEFARAGTLSEASVTAVLLAAAADAGLGEREARATIRSGIGRR
jgi:hypothetical protein